MGVKEDQMCGEAPGRGTHLMTQSVRQSSALYKNNKVTMLGAKHNS